MQFNKYIIESHWGKIGKRTKIFGFSTGKHSLVKNFYLWLYDNNYCMERKKNKINEFLQKKGLI
jgi:hypothetical protein